VDGAHGNAPEAAAFKLDPRDLLRMLTVRTMKDRAGVVGARGVAPLLHEILKLSDARVHLIGHSYGCKVCLSAVCSTLPPRSAESMLLLQPAVNHRCFASDADGKGNAGGYRQALARVEQPILTTYSSHDQPLTRWFHRALTRRTDLLEPALAAWPNPPSPYAALGGYGPAGAEQDTERVTIFDPGDPYPQGPRRLVAIDGSRGIDGHGSISNPFTWWALLDQAGKGA
jgi:pimeloyl-ACP methyl ester carboxylesterase